MSLSVAELKGYKSLIALQSFHTLMLGLKMLPAYMGETYQEFFSRIELMSEKDQENMIREAAHFVRLESDELEALVCFVKDPNGVPYRSENLKNLGPDQLIEVIVAVCKEIAKIKTGLVSESEKKN